MSAVEVFGQGRQGAARAHGRRDDGLQEGPHRGRGRHRQGDRAPAPEAGQEIQDLGERTADRGDRAVLHPRRRTRRCADRGRLQHRLRRQQRGLHRLRARGRDADRRHSDHQYVSREDVPADARDAEARIYEQEAADKPENVREKIVSGKLDSWYETIVLLEQEMHNPDIRRQDRAAAARRADRKTGENVVVRRFARFAIGQ